MGDNPTKTPEEIRQDEEFARSQRSSAGRVDPDTTPAPAVDDEPETPVVVPPEKKDEEPETPAVVVPPEGETVTPPEVIPPTQKVERPERYIPVSKYQDEKKEWKKTETELAEANARIEELTALAKTPDGAAKDEDIDAFVTEHGLDRAVVDGILAIAEKRLSKGQSALSDEQMDQVNRAAEIVKAAEIEEAFDKEFTSYGEPEIKKLYPDATTEQLKKVKEHLDQVAHSKENKDHPLDFLIYKNKDEIASIFTAPVVDEPTVPQTKKPMESSRVGAGKPATYSAADFKEGGTADFTALNELDAAQRSQIIKDMDTRTYERYIAHEKGTSNGVEVTRNGRKVVLQ